MSRAAPPRNPYQGSLVRSWVLWCLKYGLLFGALILGVLVALWPYVREIYIEPQTSPLPARVIAEKKTIIRPKYTAETHTSGRMLQVEAEAAEQVNDAEIRLDKPAAEVQLSDGHTLVVHSKTGTITPDHQHATLEDGVRLEHDGGYVLETRAAHLHLPTHQASSDTPVTACGPMGCIHAQGFILDQENARLSFKGKTRLNIQTEQGELL